MDGYVYCLISIGTEGTQIISLSFVLPHRNPISSTTVFPFIPSPTQHSYDLPLSSIISCSLTTSLSVSPPSSFAVHFLRTEQLLPWRVGPGWSASASPYAAFRSRPWWASKGPRGPLAFSSWHFCEDPEFPPVGPLRVAPRCRHSRPLCACFVPNYLPPLG